VVGVRNNGAGNDDVVGDRPGLRSRSFDAGGFDLVFAEFDDGLLVIVHLGSRFALRRRGLLLLRG